MCFKIDGSQSPWEGARSNGYRQKGREILQGKWLLLGEDQPLRLGTVYVPLCISRSLGAQRECLQCFLNGRRVDSLASRVSGGEEGQQ